MCTRVRAGARAWALAASLHAGYVLMTACACVAVCVALVCVALVHCVAVCVTLVCVVASVCDTVWRRCMRRRCVCRWYVRRQCVRVARVSVPHPPFRSAVCGCACSVVPGAQKAWAGLGFTPG